MAARRYARGRPELHNEVMARVGAFLRSGGGVDPTATRFDFDARIWYLRPNDSAVNPMNLVTLEAVTHQYSDRVLLDKVELLINSGDKIGLLGRNGSGKTTLLRLIAGEESPQGGQITVWGGVRRQYLSQNPALPAGVTVLDYVLGSDAPQLALLRRYRAANAALQADPADEGRQAALLSLAGELDRTGGWAAESEARAILSRLGLARFDDPLEQLSGGEQRRVALARALVDPADLLILDEPTNHVDADTVAWLEETLLERPGALLMVTHDRYFLDRVVNRIVALDRRRLVVYPGNYRRYLELSTARQDLLAAREAKRQNLLRRELEWLRRGAMARSTKQKARRQRVGALQELGYDRGDDRVAIALAQRRLGKRVLTATGLSKTLGDRRLFHALDFELNPGDRVGIIGPNGSGKSTLLDILAGRMPPDQGAVSWGSTVELGYYDQQSRDLVGAMRVHDFIAARAPLIQSENGDRIEAAQMLEWFLFTREEQRAYVSSLSGGEQRRLYLLWTLIHRPNVLFLDEPTNDLDVETLAVLEQFLDRFQGCLVVVSHDRYFLDRNVDFITSFEAGVLATRVPGPYENYRRHRAVALARATGPGPDPRRRPAPTADEAGGQADTGRRLTYGERQELAALERELPRLEARVRELEKAVNEAGADYQRLQSLAMALEQARQSLDTAESRWLALADRADE